MSAARAVRHRDEHFLEHSAKDASPSIEAGNGLAGRGPAASIQDRVLHRSLPIHSIRYT